MMSTTIHPAAKRALFAKFVLGDAPEAEAAKPVHPEIVDAYECPECSQLHESEDAARDCCPLPSVTAYACPKCGELHRRKQKAIDCCAEEDAPETDNLTRFACPVCGDIHEAGSETTRTEGAFNAVSCCLSTSLDVAARWRIAQAVANQSTSWLDALAAECVVP